MASAREDKSRPGSYIISFRLPFGDGDAERRKVRLGKRDLAGASDPLQAAEARAVECERLCRAIEEAVDVGQRRDLVAEALRLKAIAREHAERLLAGGKAPADRPAPTILEAALSHESALFEEKNNPRDWRQRRKALLDFVEWNGGRGNLSDLTLDAAQRWRDELKRRYKHATVKHKLAPLRWASFMAEATWGMPHVLRDFKQPRRKMSEWRDPEVWSLAELQRAVPVLEKEAALDPRPVLALGLGGFAGLRPIEIRRLLISDVDWEGGLLAVGAREAKNFWSRRTLPLAPSILEWARLAAGPRPPEEPLLGSRWRGFAKGGMKPLEGARYTEMMKGRLAKACGRELPPRALRGSFLDWVAMSGAPPTLYEPYVGHKLPDESSVTALHYRRKVAAEKLRPIAEAAERAIRGAKEPLP